MAEYRVSIFAEHYIEADDDEQAWEIVLDLMPSDYETYDRDVEKVTW